MCERQHEHLAYSDKAVFPSKKAQHLGRSKKRECAFLKGNMRNMLTVWSESLKTGEEEELNAIGRNGGVEVWTMYAYVKKVFHTRRVIFQSGRQ